MMNKKITKDEVIASEEYKNENKKEKMRINNANNSLKNTNFVKSLLPATLGATNKVITKKLTLKQENQKLRDLVLLMSNQLLSIENKLKSAQIYL
ncbi:MAG: hypothetical protein ACFFG0_02955 [Candidatus Thorarchaeota archaeon]